MDTFKVMFFLLSIKVSEKMIKSNFPHIGSWYNVYDVYTLNYYHSQQVEGWPLLFDSLFLQNICCISALIKGEWMNLMEEDNCRNNVTKAVLTKHLFNSHTKPEKMGCWMYACKNAWIPTWTMAGIPMP